MLSVSFTDTMVFCQICPDRLTIALSGWADAGRDARDTHTRPYVRCVGLKIWSTRAIT